MWYSSATMNMTQLFSGESSFYIMFWNFTSKMSLAVVPKTSLYFASPIWWSMSSKRWQNDVDKTMEGILSSSIPFTCSSIPSIYSFMMFLSGETMRTTTFALFAFFCRCVDLIYRTFLKAGRQNWSNFFLKSVTQSKLTWKVNFFSHFDWFLLMI